MKSQQPKKRPTHNPSVARQPGRHSKGGAENADDLRSIEPPRAQMHSLTHAATQQHPSTTRPALSAWPTVPLRRTAHLATPLPMKPAQPHQLFIRGITKDGKIFRPSDWSERLAGAMSCFRPGGSQGGIGAFIGYSPYCVPRIVDEVKCVLVNEALKDIEPMAWDFVMNFARDNELQVTEAAPHDMA